VKKSPAQRKLPGPWPTPVGGIDVERLLIGDGSGLAINDIAELRRGFNISLRSRNRSPKTIKSYLEAVDLFRAFSVAAGIPTEIDRINREHIETFVADQLARWAPKTAQIRYGALRQFFKWCVEEGEITDSPMAKMGPPSVPEVPVPVVGDDDLRKLLTACDAKKRAGGDEVTPLQKYESLRDIAILRLFIDCGLRLGEVAGLSVSDVDFELEVVVVLGKGSRPRAVPFSSRTSQALDRYLRGIRKRHTHAHMGALWLGPKGPLTTNGIAQMLRRRCAMAGIDQLHPHQLRHTAAHVAAKSGLSDSDMMRIFGWRSRQMLNRYGASAADERARDAYKKLAPGDRF
jgi:site-specific recombinase XerD